MTEQDPAAEALDDPPTGMDDAVELADLEDPDLGDVQAAPGEVIGIVDGEEIRNLVDERDTFLPVVDDEGQLIGRDSFPEQPDAGGG
jgi:hypothetical protein